MSNSSNSRVVRASSFEAEGSSLIPSLVKPMTLTLVFTASLLDAQLCRTVFGTSRQEQRGEQAGKFSWERRLAGFPHLGVINRYPVTPKPARYSTLIAFS